MNTIKHIALVCVASVASDGWGRFV